MNTLNELIAPEDSQLKNTLIYIRHLDHCPPSYLYDPARKDFFEVLWLKNEFPLHPLPADKKVEKGDWIYLIPPYRVHQLNKAGKNGVLLSFKRVLLEEADTEFALDVFRIFNIQGEFSCIYLGRQPDEELEKVFQLLEAEYQKEDGSVAIIKPLLKVFLLHLIRRKETEFTTQDINQKRIYTFLLLLEEHYLEQRKIEFYAEQLGMSAKRLNQVLKDKLQKTGIQILHDRLTLESKRRIIHSGETLKEIAWQLGFKDRSYFSRFFKIQTGLTPEAFQKQVQQHIVQHENTLID